MSDSYKEVVSDDGKQVVHDGIQVVQSGLEPVPNGLKPVLSEDLPAKKQHPRRKLIIGIGAAVAIVVIGLAVGLGVALSRSHSTPKSASDEPASPAPRGEFTSSASLSSSTSEPSTSTSDPTSTISTASETKNASPTPTAEKYTCPGANNTEIHMGTGKSAASTYYVFCDADIHATNKKDLSSTVQGKFADCLGLCDSMNNFQKRADVALTWNFEGTGQQKPGTCWCVTGSKKRVISNPGNMVAILATENPVVDL
ncbi:uncharacterized protein LDX57_010102 [Aspergillus melleus]|uniref:uncharacterized protein n=1 Tax=Aspergillus melleus TaxID=138277 RepID=UPI001E8D9A4B|nr:uncharacterized protein LDX57_010102 [Aspergillus melleus]KAH8432467.1 hypothetical protein LDX57_010102 [Aspergillus melleus]